MRYRCVCEFVGIGGFLLTDSRFRPGQVQETARPRLR